MIIEKITYQKTYSIGPYLTDRVGFEASITEPSLDYLVVETPDYVLCKLKEMADEWHKKTYPHLYQEQSTEENFPMALADPRIIPVINKEKSTDQSNDVVSGIQSADSIEKLTTWKLVSSQDKELYAMYMKRLKELTK